MRDLGFDEIVGWSFTDPGEAGRLRIPAGRPARRARSSLANPLSEDQSVMRTTLLGSLLDVAARNLARGADRVALFESGRVYLRRRRAAGERRRSAGRLPGRARRRRSPSRTGSAASRSGPLVAKSWRGGGEPADFFALKGVLEALAGQLGAELAFEPPPEPFLHPGRSARGRRRRRARRLDRRGPPAGLPRVGPRRRRSPSKSTWRRWSRAASAGEEIYEDVTTFPAVYQDLAVVVAAEVAAAEVRAAVLAGGGELLRSPRSSTSTRASSSARDARAWRCGSSSGPPTAPSPTRRSPALRAAIEAELEKIGGSLRG